MVLQHILTMLCEIFSITPIMSTTWPRWSPDLKFCEVLPVGTPKNTCVCIFCWWRRGTSPWIVNACHIICSYPRIFEWISQSKMRYIEVWRTFWASFSRNTNYFWTHIDTDMWNLCQKFVQTFHLQTLICIIFCYMRVLLPVITFSILWQMPL
jgi:hypothetical protein